MQTEISRILSSDLNHQVLESLQNNESQIQKLEQILSQKNSQVDRLHRMINQQLQTTMEQNEKLKWINFQIRKSIRCMHQQMCQIKKYCKTIMQKVSQQFGNYTVQAQHKIIQFVNNMQSNNIDNRALAQSKINFQNLPSQYLSANFKMKALSQFKTFEVQQKSNAHLLERLQKLQQTVVNLKQQKWALQKQVKKYKTLLQSQSQQTDSLQAQRQYSSTNSQLAEQHKRQTILKHFNEQFSNFQQKKYYGEIINNKKHGTGICEYADNMIFQGQFIGGYRQGLGQLRYGGQIIYKGYWHKDKPEGKGILYIIGNENIAQYCGWFKNGYINGYGTAVYRNGCKVRAKFDKSISNIVGEGLLQDRGSNRIQYGYVNEDSIKQMQNSRAKSIAS